MLKLALYLNKIYPFRLHDSAISNNFIGCCNYHYQLLLKCLHSPHKIPHTHFWSFPHHPLLVGTHSSTLHTHSPFLDPSYLSGIIPYVVSCVWLLLLSILVLSSIHGVSCVSSFFFFCGWIVFHRVDVYMFSIYRLMDI